MLGLRFIEAQPDRSLMDNDTGLLDVLPEHSGGEREDGFRLQDGWTSPAVTSR